MSGPSVVLSDTNTVSPTFTAPIVSNDTEMKFSLTVTDDKNSSNNPSIVTVTVKAIVQEQSESIPSIGNETISENMTSTIPSLSNYSESIGNATSTFPTSTNISELIDEMIKRGIELDESGNHEDTAISIEH